MPKWKHTCTVCGKSFFYGHERVMNPPLIPEHKLTPTLTPTMAPRVRCVGTGTWGAPEGMGYESEHA